MTLILLAIVVAAAVSVGLLRYGSGGYQDRHMFAEIAGVLGLIAVGCCAVIYCALAWKWFAAEHKATIINREYGTNYTPTEIFYGSEVIDTIRNLDRKRYEIK